jgi:putative aldouronate transport system substrate-binding protein
MKEDFVMKKKRKLLISWLLTLVLVMSVVLSGCGAKDKEAGSGGSSGGSGNSNKQSDTSEGSNKEVEETDTVKKPEKIKIMVDGTLVTKENGRDAFEKKWEELTGIDLVITQPDHDAYYDVVGQMFAGGDWPDVILLGSTYYAGYASEGILWDMSEAWEKSEPKSSGRIVDEALVDGLYIGDGLYGISPARGNGCVTYVKKAWLDRVNLDAPTNFDEYIKMLEAFTTQDPDGNGVNGDTYGVSSAGLIGSEAPYTNYLPEFYQDAFPSFYRNSNGEWVDGFTEDAMVSALERLRDAYQAGYIDKESLTNGTSDCRNKFYEDKFGVFTYWAGTWATNLKTNLEANGLDGELIPLKPIAEVRQYIERQAPVWCITTASENPEGVFKYFFETMLDGGEMQKLWTYGVEDVHWSTKAGEVCGKTYEEGQFHMLENLEKKGTQYTKNHIDPILAISKFTQFEDPGINNIAPEAMTAAQVFYANSRLAELVISTEEMSQYNGDLMSLKKEIIANVVTQGMSIEDEMKRFNDEGGAEWSKAIVDSLNAQK